MGGALPMPSSQFPVSGNCSTPLYLISTATALRLGELLHHSSRKHNLCLGAILSSSFKGLGHFSHVFGSKEVVCGRKGLFEGVGFLELSSTAFSSTHSSCISFFSGNEAENRGASKGNSDVETARRNSFDGRLWTNVLLGLNVLFFVAQMATRGKLMLWGAKINSLIDKGQFWRFATSSLLHANIGHLMVNCYSLNSIGPTVESISGPGRFLSVYFTSAVASSAMSYWFCPAPAVGASGAIFGLLGGLFGGAAMPVFVGPAWTYEGRTNDGRSVFVDKAPISYITKRRSK